MHNADRWDAFANGIVRDKKRVFLAALALRAAIRLFARAG
jgi:hypothetical protein